MDIQTGDKKKFYLNLVALIIILGASAYLLFPMIFKSSNLDVLPEDSVDLESNTFVKKYKTLKKIETDIFDDIRLKSLKQVNVYNHESPEKGNPKPFSSPLTENLLNN